MINEEIEFLNDRYVSGRVSIIMGIYNCADTLAEAIDSILAQSYNNWELILCDDGSIDNTYNVARKYQEAYPEKIKLLQHKENCGLNITLNDCLAQASGEFIARMDGDDISLPTRLEKEVSFLRCNPNYSIVSCPMIYFDEKGEWGKGKVVKEPSKKTFAYRTPFCHAPAMVKREAFKACKGYSLDKSTLRSEDYDLWGRMYALGFRGGNLEEHLYMMRDGRKAFSRRKFSMAVNSFITKVRIAKLLHLPFWAYIRAIRPLLVSLIPWPLYCYLHKKKKKA